MSLAQAHGLLTAPGARFEMDEAVIRGVKTRVWKNTPPTLREVMMVSRMYGAREFIVYENDRVTFESFYRATMALAQELQKRGVPRLSPRPFAALGHGTKTGDIQHRHFYDIGEFLRPGDLLVVNESKVFKARLRTSDDPNFPPST